jgi:hypothetical protein
MYKKTGIGDSVASEMDRILNDSSFQSKFEPMVVTASVEEDEGYNAFIRLAKKKDVEETEEDSKKSKSSKKKEEKEESKKGKFPFFEKGKGKGKKEEEKEDPKKGKFPFFEKGKGKGKKDEEKEEPKKGKDKKDKKAEAQALEYIIASISQTSEVLDNLGLEKSATNALSLLNGIIREASIKQAEEDPEFMEDLKYRVDNSEPFEFVSFEDEEDEEGEEDGEYLASESDKFKGLDLNDDFGDDSIDTEIDISEDPISEELGDDLIFNKEVIALTRELENWIKK